MSKYKVLFEEWLNMTLTSSKNNIYLSNKWRFNRELFYQDMGEKPEGSVLTLLDNNKGFVPGNCIWAYPIEDTWSKVFKVAEKKRKKKKIVWKTRNNSKTGVSGVTWNNQKLRWWARIRVNGEIKHLIFSKDKNEAIKKRLEAEVQYYGEIQQKGYEHLLG